MAALAEPVGPILAHVAMGIGLAACAGLRAFLPLFVLGLAARFELAQLADSLAWIAGDAALVVFGVAVIAEVLADKFPLVDHALDAVGAFVKPVSGALVTATLVKDWTPLYATVLCLIVGGTTAGAVHLAKAKMRLLSTLGSAGLANPWISAIEDVAALGTAVAAILLPFVLLALFALGIGMAGLVLRARRRPGG